VAALTYHGSFHGGSANIGERTGSANGLSIQAFSLLLTNISYRGSASGKLDMEDSTHRDFSPTDCQVIVRDGTLLTGMMDKRALGDGGGGIIHIMFNEDGWQRCASFIGEVQFVVNYWLTHHGFSCGIGDTVADPGTMAKIAQLIQDAKQSVQEIIKQYQGGALEEKPGRYA
jgi:DNA-directed RNA polymerase II subunit RPB1